MNACKIQRIPVYLKIGIIDERKTVVNFAKLFQYFAPIVLGIISEKSNIITVITVETNPTKTSSEIPLAKKVMSMEPKPVETFPTKVEDDHVWVGINNSI